MGWKGAMDKRTRLSRRKVWDLNAWASWALLGVSCLGVFALYHGLRPGNEALRLSAIAHRSAKSVALVAVEYWLTYGDSRVCQTVTVGTGFLADRSGRLLTAKHVVCPWLMDSCLEDYIQKLTAGGKTVGFGHRMWVWFDGQKALRPARVAGLDGGRLEDLFYGETAYRSDGAEARAEILGVGFQQTSEGGEVDYGMNGDVAVVQVSPPPLGLEPLPLASGDAEVPLRLAPLVALGYPLGIVSMPDCAIAVSATAGHVRRCFSNVIQANVSLHTGNSGGPVLDAQGRVVGIASQMFRDPDSWIPMPQPDMGQILPIASGRRLLAAAEAGKLLPDGVICPALECELEGLFEQARRGDWRGACRRERTMTSRLPARLLAGAVLHGCGGDTKTALARIDALQSIEPENGDAAFLRLLLTRGRGSEACNGKGVAAMLACDWRSKNEFYGYLGRILAGRASLRETQDAGDCPGERAMLDWVVGLLFEDRHDYEIAEALLEKAMLALADQGWPQAFAKAELEKVQALRLGLLRSDAERIQYRRHQDAFEKRAQRGSCDRRKKKGANELFEHLLESRTRVCALQEMIKLQPLDIQYPSGLAFEFAKEGQWGEAADVCGRVALPYGRESANRLGLGLFHIQMLRLSGRDGAARLAARSFLAAVKDPWYRSLAKVAIGELSERELSNHGELDPVSLLTLYTVLGLKSEAEGNGDEALERYHLALDSGLTDWYEYQLAKVRIEKMRQGKWKENRD